ncbi:c-type cytochrome [Rhodanobacter sp. AS-Z3]|uniref:c-type cytochrome n=1 Tax=Rhodanobacter sp. AS-Z3 TaxID=3031330 RepID=UPI00247AB1FD|nr:c-type cytochrome [Rhodanobacter sp. AS-Z3]WEN15657.1 c-type cytochrome [Rhodanobacter sp. AS-Z3]
MRQPSLRHPATRRWIPALLLASLALPASAALAVDAAAIAQAGNGKGAVPCMACHGLDGAGQAAAGHPRLAALDATYLQKQLDDFAGGARSNAIMQPIATALTEDERQAMANYYSKMPVPPALAKPTVDMPAAASVGALLATRGDWSRNVPGCVQCHGPGGVGVGANFPPLAGQPAAYIASQLKAWQDGTRHNDPLQLMQHLSSALTAQDIQAVAAWFAAQPLPAPETAP